MNVAIPLEQGRFFNLEGKPNKNGKMVAIPLEQGRFFNYTKVCHACLLLGRNPSGAGTVFQSFQHEILFLGNCRNPFGAGTVFQSNWATSTRVSTRRNPFGAGTVFQCD